MPTRRDLQDSFDRVARQVESDVPRHLHQTIRIGRRRNRVRRTVRVGSVAAALAGVLIAGPATLRWIDGLRVNTPAATATTTPSQSGGSAIVGSYSVTMPETSGVIHS